MSPSTESPRVLIVEDDAAIRDFLRTALAGAGFRLIEAITGEEALDRAQRQPPDLVILDLGLPDIDGQLVLEKLRQWLNAPIIVVSARNQESQKVAALDHGADDYLTKPFGTAELLARIRVALRHADGSSGGNSPVFESGNLKVDLAAHRVFVRDSEIHLTPIEYNLLVALIRNAGKVMTHRRLLTQIWGPERAQDHHYLRVFMTGLRRKIEVDPAQPQYLLTEQGIGYRFAVSDE
ncbi:MAG TPA: response regulator [Pirellulales bacterium]|jgi:two-component system KDP operon response regulator KdpE|nr:response regulator [Pirellulales bacterium]